MSLLLTLLLKKKKEIKLAIYKKYLISAVWILDSHDKMDKKITRAPFLSELPVKHQLKGVFKAVANKTIKYFSIYDKNGTSAWPAVLLNDNY